MTPLSWSPSTATTLSPAVGSSTFNWVFDQVAPTAFIVQSPPLQSNSRLSKFEFSCSETRCVFDFTTDGGSSWTRVVDSDGGSSTNAVASLDLDTHLIESPRRVTSNSTARFVLSATPAAAAIQYRLNADPWRVVPLSSNASRDSLTLRPSQDWNMVFSMQMGSQSSPVMHEVEFRSISATGAVDASPVSHRWVVDPSEGPDPVPLVCSVASQQGVVTTSPTAAFELGSSHTYTWYDCRVHLSGQYWCSLVAECRFEYRVDSDGCDDWTPGSSTLVVGPVSAGSHTLDVRCASTETFGSFVQHDRIEWTYVPLPVPACCPQTHYGCVQPQVRAYWPCHC